VYLSMKKRETEIHFTSGGKFMCVDTAKEKLSSSKIQRTHSSVDTQALKDLVQLINDAYDSEINRQSIWRVHLREAKRLANLMSVKYKLQEDWISGKSQRD